MKVTDYIKEEHKQVEELFEQFEESPNMSIVQEIGAILYRHHHAEEETVFPGVAKKSEPKEEVVNYLMAEHDVIHLQLEDIFRNEEEDLFEAKVHVLQELVEHHVKEEEDAFFKHAEEAYTETQLENATKKFKAASEEYDSSAPEAPAEKKKSKQ